MNEWECYERLYGKLAEYVYFGITWRDEDDESTGL